jgi:hypothetical protein
MLSSVFLLLLLFFFFLLGSYKIHGITLIPLGQALWPYPNLIVFHASSMTFLLTTSNLMLHLQFSRFANSQRLVMLLSFLVDSNKSEVLTLPISFHTLCLITSFQLKGASNIATLHVPHHIEAKCNSSIILQAVATLSWDIVISRQIPQQ